MPLTLSTAQNLSNSKLSSFIIDEFRKSALLDLMPFDNTVKSQGGKSLLYTYNRISTLPTAAGRAINSEYASQEAESTAHTVALKTFGGSFQIDRVLAMEEAEIVDLIQFELEQKASATRALFHDWFINGDSAMSPVSFDGLDKAIKGSSTDIGVNQIDLSTSAKIDANWKLLLDDMRRLQARLIGAPTVWLMNTDMYAVFQSVMDRAGISLASKENYGDEAVAWGGALVMPLGDKPGSASPIISTALSGDGAGETSVFAVRLGLDAVHGVCPSGSGIVSSYLPDLTLPGAVKLGEVEMVAAIAVKCTRAAGVLRKIKIA